MSSLRFHDINFGSGTHAKQRYDRLNKMIQEIIYQHRRDKLFERANALIEFRRTMRWTRASERNWIVEFTPEEWKALSSGLRHTTALQPFSSMYQWLNLHRVEDHGD